MPKQDHDVQHKRYPPEILTHGQVLALLDACGHGTAAAERNRALIAVLYRAGLRIGEALALEPHDLDQRNGAVRVRSGKGGRSRTVGMDPHAFELVGVWLNTRTDLGINQHAPVFCTRQGRSISAAYCRRLLAGLGRRANIAARVHPHGLRHTHASQLRAEGVEIGIISKQLGHRSIATTAHYLDHIAPWDVVRTVGGRGWG